MIYSAADVAINEFTRYLEIFGIDLIHLFFY